MIDWTDLRQLLALAGGTVLALLVSTAETWRARLFCVGAGLSVGFFGTEPIIHWIGASFAGNGFPYLICAALAMTGDRIARRLMSLVDTVKLPWPPTGK